MGRRLNPTLGRNQFSEEKAKTVSARMPQRQESLMISLRDLYPASWPAETGKPLSRAHRELPSMMMATCLGSDSLSKHDGSASSHFNSSVKVSCVAGDDCEDAAAGLVPGGFP